MDFWERLDMEIETKSNRKTVTSELGLAPNAVSLWIRRKTYPAADVAVKLARLLDTSVEYLVDGNHPASFIPERIRSIVDALILIEDEARLEPIRILADAAAPTARKGPSSLPVADLGAIGKGKASIKKA